MTIYSCIISHPNTGQVLVLDEGDRRFLPAIEDGEHCIPDEVEIINQAVRERFGLKVTVLRHLQVGEAGQLCELENHQPDWTPPAGSRWVNRADLAKLTLPAPEQRPSLEAWLAEAGSGVIPSRRPPWERPGWFNQAVEWVTSQLERLGYVAVGPVEQIKAAWSGSSILRAATTEGDLYFKATYAKPPNEVALIQALAERWPANVPSILAADREQRWMLMADFGGEMLDERPADDYPAVARRFAEIQIDCGADLEPWSRLGCPERGPEAMAGLMESLLADQPALQVGPYALDEAALEQLQRFTPQLKAMWARLAEYAIPHSLHQQDFRGGNIAVTGQGYLYFDWNDTVIAHPFFSVQRMLDFLPAPAGVPRWDGRLQHQDDQARRNIRDAYLQPWTVYEPIERLVEAFELSRYLNEIYQAVRWYLELPYLEPGCPWAITVATEGPPAHLREVLRLSSFLQEVRPEVVQGILI
jgi:hypothetical protein